jgi:hypothetical protein
MRFACLAFALYLSMLMSNAQTSEGPPPVAYQHLYFYDGSNNLQYDCVARQFVSTTAWTISDGSLVSIVVSSSSGTVTTASAHGLYIGARVTVSGSTTTALNTTYTVTSVPSSTTFTVTTSGVANGTYNNSSLSVSTNNPLLTAPVWAIKVYTYSGTSLTASYWASGQTGRTLKCSDRTSY